MNRSRYGICCRRKRSWRISITSRLLSSAVIAVAESVSLGLVKVDLLSDTEETLIGAVLASFHSFLSPGRSVTERFCVEEITDAISALGGITAVGALVGAFYSVSERTLSEQGKSLSFLKLDSQ